MFPNKDPCPLAIREILSVGYACLVRKSRMSRYLLNNILLAAVYDAYKEQLRAQLQDASYSVLVEGTIVPNVE